MTDDRFQVSERKEHEIKLAAHPKLAMPVDTGIHAIRPMND